MKIQLKFATILLLIITLFFTACDLDGGGETKLTLTSVTQLGGTSGTVTTTDLTLTFDVNPTTLTASDITVTGATKGALSGTGTTRSLAISDISIANGGTVSVAVTSPTGFVITGSPKTVVVYIKPVAIGDPYRGGVVAYILLSSDPGYNAEIQHGLIAAAADHDTNSAWITGGTTQTTELVTTNIAYGTGQANSTAMMGQTGYTGGAAKICDDFTNSDTGTGVYSDWYLPSQVELDKLFVNKIAIGGFFDDYYWCSSEMASNLAYWQYFMDGTQAGSIKSAGRKVRAVRDF